VRSPAADGRLTCPRRSGGAHPQEPNITRYILRGSTWLTGRLPKNPRLPFADLNKKWRTHLYSLSFEIKGHEVYVDLAGVRHDDIRQIMQVVLGLDRKDYEVMYYRTLERFMVLLPHQAHKLAVGLGAVPRNGAGRDAGKTYMVKDFEVPIPVVIRKRTKSTAHLVVYRVRKGATAAYKVEVRLRGKRRDREEFHEQDIEKLDKVLLDLVTEHGLATIPKPARWEPRTFTTSVERGPFDPYIRQLPEKAWRGPRVPERVKRTVLECHTPDTVRLLVCGRDPGSFPPAARIRSAIPTPPCSSTSVNAPTGSAKTDWTCIEKRGTEVARYVQQHQQQPEAPARPPARSPWNQLTDDIFRSKLPLHEVVLDPEQSPRDLLRVLAGGVLGKIGVMAICAVDQGGHADTWESVKTAVKNYPAKDQGIDTLVVVIDASAVLDVAAAVVGNQEVTITEDGEIIGDLDAIFEPGPLMPAEPPPEFTGPRADALPSLFRATGAWLDNIFRELRQLGEQTGVRIIAVTCDGRTDGGTGPMKRSHYFTDKRVRSSIGDAGRQHAHMRYLVERVVRTTWKKGHRETVEEADETIGVEDIPHVEHEYVVGNIIAVKDEAEGLPGRLIYEAPVRPDRPKWKRRKPS
jgi:hypothetical protein